MFLPLAFTLEYRRWTRRGKISLYLFVTLSSVPTLNASAFSVCTTKAGCFNHLIERMNGRTWLLDSYMGNSISHYLFRTSIYFDIFLVSLSKYFYNYAISCCNVLKLQWLNSSFSVSLVFVFYYRTRKVTATPGYLGR